MALEMRRGPGGTRQSEVSARWPCSAAWRRANPRPDRTHRNDLQQFPRQDQASKAQLCLSLNFTFGPKLPFRIVRHHAMGSRPAHSTNSRTRRHPTRRSIFVARRPGHRRAIRMSSGLHECMALARKHVLCDQKFWFL